MELIYKINIEFSIPAGTDTRKGTLPHIDNYLDTLESITGHLSRHFGYINISSRKLKNISNGTFYYTIENRLLEPGQLSLDGIITPFRVMGWLQSSISYILAHPESSQIEDYMDKSAESAGLNDSLLYVPFALSSISKDLQKFITHHTSLLIPPRFKLL